MLTSNHSHAHVGKLGADFSPFLSMGLSRSHTQIHTQMLLFGQYLAYSGETHKNSTDLI